MGPGEQRWGQGKEGGAWRGGRDLEESGGDAKMGGASERGAGQRGRGLRRRIGTREGRRLKGWGLGDCMRPERGGAKPGEERRLRGRGPRRGGGAREKDLPRGRVLAKGGGARSLQRPGAGRRGSRGKLERSGYQGGPASGLTRLCLSTQRP